MEKEAQEFKDFFKKQEEIQVFNWFFLPFYRKTKKNSFFPFHASKSKEEIDDLEIIKILIS